MLGKDIEKRWLKIGTLISFGVGMIIGIITGNTLLAVVFGVILAVLVQRIAGTSESKEDESEENYSPS